MALDLFRLLVFVTVVDRNGYSAAARPLNLAQPTVSHHVSELERTLDTRLLHYEQRAVHLTAAGREVYRVAKVMLREQERLGESLDDLAHGRRGRVRLGASMAFEQGYFLQRAIAPFCRKHERTRLSLRFGHSRREAQAVLDREIDLAYVLRWHLPTDAQFELLHTAELTFMAAADHPLSALAEVGVDQIAEAGLITAPQSGVESSYYNQLLREFGLDSDHSVLEIEGLQPRVFAAEAGLGVIAMFIPEYGRDADRGSLRPLAVGGPPIKVEAGLVRRPGEALSSSADAFAGWLRGLTRHCSAQN
ncbi:LysR family transcriptional regulator [Amycolatopsis rhabdoformis]|uniref:LysR family transcriptional regulator n=1 Tax=Amycolatopsis rhabdoformis TaxID=1448059 RepID=A0ABZ1IA61_9PSEU|nr:LysR family transcriptional regulator [Amycolatopsis rhabdoformis]WSE31310.1 LysR family transcriptional regulator [Amycolatopsis rhabdoformis]